MGGFHTMHISRYYPDTFDYVGLFSAALIPRENATGQIYKNIDAPLKTQIENGLQGYRIAIGKTDFLYQANQDFIKKLDAFGLPYGYVETEEAISGKTAGSIFRSLFPNHFKNGPTFNTMSLYSGKSLPKTLFLSIPNV